MKTCYNVITEVDGVGSSDWPPQDLAGVDSWTAQ